MRIKVYHCNQVESAVRQARLELGEEAVLLESARAEAHERHLGLYKVAFAAPASASPAPPEEPSSGDAQLAELSRQIQDMRRLLFSYRHTCYLPAGELLQRPLLAEIYQDLAAQDVEPEIAAQLVAALSGKAERATDRRQLELSLGEHLQALVPVLAEIGLPGAKPAVGALVGPTGVGKTTTIAKLAMQLDLEQRRRVLLLSFDADQPGAQTRLQNHASQLGVEHRAVEGVAGLRQALANGNGCELVLIDTPGYGLAEIGEAVELAHFLSASDRIDTHLVISASTKPKDLRRIIEEYSVFGPRKLLFTKLDETLSFGPLVNEAIRTKWPLSYLGVGQRVPEDLVEARPTLLSELILRR